MENVTLGQIAIVVAFVVALIKGLDYLFSPIKKTVDRLEVLEEKSEKRDAEFKDMHEFMYASLIAIKALLKHGIDDGNNKDGMLKASETIDTYLNRKVKE